MMTVRELRYHLSQIDDQDAPVLLVSTDNVPCPIAFWGEKRYGTAGRHLGALVPYDDTTDTYDEEEGDDSVAAFVLWSQEG